MANEKDGVTLRSEFHPGSLETIEIEIPDEMFIIAGEQIQEGDLIAIEIREEDGRRVAVKARSA